SFRIAFAPPCACLTRGHCGPLAGRQAASGLGLYQRRSIKESYEETARQAPSLAPARTPWRALPPPSKSPTIARSVGRRDTNSRAQSVLHTEPHLDTIHATMPREISSLKVLPHEASLDRYLCGNLSRARRKEHYGK